MNKILVIVPAYNEEKNISRVISDLTNCGLSLDIVVINDGSIDKTEESARKKDCKVISLPFNLGIGGAVQTGFKYAYENDYDFAIQFDGDGQHLASEIGTLLENVINEACDVAIGSRFLNNNGYRAPLARRLGIKIFSFINTLIIRQRITDNTSGFRAYNRKAIKFLSQNYTIDYPEVEAIILLHKNQFRMLEVPVRMQHRQFGDSSINTLKSIYYMIKVILSVLIGVFRKRERID